MAEQGFELNIDGLQEAINKAEQSITKLAKTTNTQTKTIVNSFKSISEGGLDVFVQKLNQANEVLSKIGSHIGGNQGIGKVGEDASKAADDVVKLANAVNELVSDDKKTNYKSGAVAKIEYEIEEKLKRLSELQEKLNFYYNDKDAKEAVRTGAANIYDSEVEAINLMNEIDLLEEKLKKEQEIANAKGKQNAIDEENAKHWVQMEKARKKEERDETTKMYRDLFKEAEDLEKAKTQIAKKEAKDRAKAEKEASKQKKEDEFKKNTSYSGAMAYSQQTKSINDQIKAIQYLKIARDNLDKSKLGAKEYENRVKAINKEIRRQQEEVNRLTGRVRESNNVLTKLGSQLALLFSVSAIKNYVTQLIAVRGEFEMQQRSLQVLLKNKSEANKLWSQTVDLAVKSPFRVKELVSYTKQLAAYRIESGKLHDTTRRLADVSAGLGVDMQRLILAFGQVKAASFLRGTELRQFTEAGIPMLEELSQYLTEMEGIGVSVGEVFERISKRMISFKDVEAVFHRMTDAGGTFYKMQEEQSKTLKGMISNLKDSIDLMLNSIGESQEGVLKGSIDLIRRFVENWRLTAAILKTVITVFAMYKLNVVLTKKALIDYAIANKIVNDSNIKQLSIVNLVKLGWSALTKTIKSALVATKAFVLSNPIITVLSVLAGVIFKVSSTMKEHKEEIDEINKRYEEMSVKIREINSAFANANLEKNLAKQREELKKLLKLAEKEYYLNFDFNIEELDEKSIAEAYNKVYAEIQAQSKFAEDFEKTLSIHNRRIAQDDLNEDFNELGVAAQNLSDILEKNIIDLREYLIQTGQYTEEFKKALAPRDVAGGETELAYMERLKEAYEKVTGGVRDFSEINSIYHRQLVDLTLESKNSADALRRVWGDKLFNGIKESANAMNTLDSKFKEAKKEFDEFIEKVNIPSMLSVSEKENRFKLAIDTAASQNNWSEFEKEYITKWLNQKYTINIGYTPAKKDTEKDYLADWAKQVKPEIEKINNRLKDKLKGKAISASLFALPDEDSDRDKYVKTIEDRLKEIEDIKERGKVKGQKIFTKEEVYNANELSKEAEELKKILAIIDKSKGDKGKDWYLELAKGLQSVHKDFLTLNKDLGKTRAKELALVKNTEVLKTAFTNAGIGMEEFMSRFDLTTEEGMISALETVLDKLPAKAQETKIALEKILSDIKGEAEISVSIENREVLDEYFNNMFRDYELTMEVENMGLNSDWYADLFNFEKTDLNKIRRNIQNSLGLDGELLNDVELFSAIGKSNLPEETKKMLRGHLTKIMDEDAKALEESMKKFMEYSKNALSSVGQIRVAESQELTRINSIINEEIKKAGDDTEKLKELEDLRTHLLEGIKNKAESDVDKALWEEFKGSEGFIRIFQDAEYASNKAINNMLSELEKLKGGMSDMNVDEIKAIADAMEKLENIKMERFPMVEMFKSMRDLDKNKEAIRNLRVNGNAELGITGVAKGGFGNRKDLDKSIKEYDKAIEKLRKEQKTYADAGKTEQASQIDATIKGLIKQRKELQNVKDAGEDASQRIKEGFGKFGGKINEIGNSLSVFQGSLENMGVNFSDGMKDALGTAQEVLGGIGTMAQGIASGNYLQALMGLFQTLGALFQIHDKRNERQIQGNIKAVEKLGKAYEKLEKKIDEAYSIKTLQSATNGAISNLEEQIRIQEETIALEKDKKKSDEDKIAEYEEQLAQQQEQLEELKKEVVSKATAGAFDNVLSVADEFVDAWLTAFQETGDGLSGLEDNFNEFMLNIIKRQASMQIVGAYADKWKKGLEKYVNANDTELTTAEATAFAESVKADMPELSEALKAYFEAMKSAVDIDGQGDTMSGLQRGVTEITEETAGVIAAYLDSLRFYVADNNTQLKQFLQSYNTSANTYLSPILTQVTNIANDTSEIRSLLSSIISTYTGNAGGKGVKMIM